RRRTNGSASRPGVSPGRCSRPPSTGWRRGVTHFETRRGMTEGYRAATAARVAEAIAGARHAQPQLDALAVADRALGPERFRQLLYARRSEVASVISAENGKPAPGATMTEVATTLEIARYYARMAPEALAPRTLTSASLALWRKRFLVAPEPYGTVGV